MPDRIDFEPVFFAPFVSTVMTVDSQWIDYNGHLNMAYYNVLIDRAVDEAFLLVGLGPDYVQNRGASFFTAEAHVRYLGASMKSAHGTLPPPSALGRAVGMRARS